MAPSLPPVRRRRRTRRGSLGRPVDGRLYRAAFLLLAIPVVLAAFTIHQPVALPAPTLPPSFDAATTSQLATSLADTYPDRIPGSPGALDAAKWFTLQLKPYGLPAHTDAWDESIPGLGSVQLRNVWVVAPGSSPDTIVVMAHRDDIGVGPGADDNASGTAALIELARAYAQPALPVKGAVQSAHTLVFLSTDGGSFGGLGAVRFVRRSLYRNRIVAVLNLDAIAGPGPAVVQVAGDTPRSTAPSLVATVARSLIDGGGTWPEHPGFFGQLVDLAFPLTLYEQGPFLARGISAVTLTTAGLRPPDAFGDTPQRMRAKTIALLGRAAQEVLGSLDQVLEPTQGASSYLWVGNRVVRGWAVELVLIALLVPFLVGAVDLFAYCRRRHIPLRPALGALRSRVAFWLFVGVSFEVFRELGAWPGGPARPPNPATMVARDWPILTLTALLLVISGGWLVARHRLVPRRRPTTSAEDIAGHAVALLALALVALLVVATNPFALVFILPALHVWLWLPLVRSWRAPFRIAVFAAGLAGPLIALASLAWRFGLGLDAPWYLVELIGVGYVSFLPVALALAAAAAAGQLAAAAAGRYAPYPAPHERGPRGPIRALVRALVLAERSRRRRVRARDT